MQRRAPLRSRSRRPRRSGRRWAEPGVVGGVSARVEVTSGEERVGSGGCDGVVYWELLRVFFCVGCGVVWARRPRAPEACATCPHDMRRCRELRLRTWAHTCCWRGLRWAVRLVWVRGRGRSCAAVSPGKSFFYPPGIGVACQRDNSLVTRAAHVDSMIQIVVWVRGLPLSRPLAFTAPAGRPPGSPHARSPRAGPRRYPPPAQRPPRGALRPRAARAPRAAADRRSPQCA